MIDISTKSYRKVSGALKESQIGRFVRRSVRQAAKHEEALKDAGIALKETVVITVKGAKDEAEVAKVLTVAREATKKVGQGIKVGVLKSRAGQRGFAEVGLLRGIASSGLAAVTGILSYKNLKQDLKEHEYGRALASGAGVAASATTLLANASAVVMGVSTSSVGLGTAVGGMSAAEGIAAAPHVAGAFALGAAVGVGIQEGSAYASKKYLGREISPGQIIGDTMTAADKLVSKLWSDPSKPEYTQTLGWKIAGWLTPTLN